MNSLLLSPHNDDEGLFAALLIQRHNPVVVVCLQSFKQGAAGHHNTRELETAAALDILGCKHWSQWSFPDVSPPWSAIRDAITDLADKFDHVFAPEPRWERNQHTPDAIADGYGIAHHDAIGQYALDAFGRDRFTGYLTYTKFGGRDTDGDPLEDVPAEHIQAKLRALACYRSQIALAATRPHFLSNLNEYVSRPVQPVTPA